MKAFTLIDVLVSISLTSLLVVLLVSFLTDLAQFRSFLRKEQMIRTELFTLVKVTLPSLVREASAIDFLKTNDQRLSIFMDKFEQQAVQIELERNSAEERAQLFFRKGNQKVFLNSPKTVIDHFSVETTAKPDRANASKFQEQRAYQPTVRFRLSGHFQKEEGARERNGFSFLENPHFSYESLSTLRNYSFSNLRS